MSVENAIEVEGLVKRFGEKVALDGVSFEVPRGTVCGLLGPNGAGKTTAVRVLTTLSVPTPAPPGSPGSTCWPSPRRRARCSASPPRTRRSTPC